MIPTNHQVEISKATGDLDVWGNYETSEPLFKKANIRSQSGIEKDSNGEDKAYSYRILFIGFEDITHDDTIRFVEPNGEVVGARPIAVKFLRGITGNVGYTKVVF